MDTVFQDIREEVLNNLLIAAWNKYTKALEVGETIQIEDEATLWLDDILQKRLKPLIEAEVRAVDDSE